MTEINKEAGKALDAETMAGRDADAFDLPRHADPEPAAPEVLKSPAEALQSLMSRSSQQGDMETLPARAAAALARADQADYARLDTASKAQAASLLVGNLRNREYAAEFARHDPEAVQAMIRHVDPDPSESYTVRNPRTNKNQQFKNPKEAGAAFFNEDRADRPHVIHAQENRNNPGGRFARVIADTQIHATYANGETKYVKTLPNSHKGDAEFRAGYMDALEKSVNNRLKQADWEKARPDHSAKSPNLDNKLYDDLETLGRVDTSKAISAWKNNAPEWATPPAYADPTWQKEVAQARRAADLIDAATRGPAVGVMQIDGRPATAIRYERTEKDGRPAYSVTFTMDNKTVTKHKGLDDNDLTNTVGDRNAKTIREADADRGTLKGSTLANEYGISPEENARRLAETEDRKQAEFDRAQPDDKSEINVVSNEPDRVEEINAGEAIARAARMREMERQQRLTAEQDHLGQQAESKRVTVENLSEKAQEQQDANQLAARAGANTSYPDQALTEREKNRQVELMQQVHHQFRVSGAKFHFKDQPQTIAFKDKGARMVSASNDERVAHAMATMAEAKGWKTIRVSGHPDFQREVWMEASLRGLAVRGFRPQEKDLQELEARRDARSKNVVERDTVQARKDVQKDRTAVQQDAGKAQAAPQPEETHHDAAPPLAKTTGDALRAYAGRVLEHGAAPYNHDPKEKANYFVTLATDKGEQTVWGVDLKRAMAESNAQKGDDVRLEFRGKQPVTVTALERDKAGNVIGATEIQTNRNTWEVHKSDRAKVVEAVAAEVLTGKGVKNQHQRAAIMKAIGERLEQREKAGKVPAVPVYDKAAPSTQQQIDRGRPQVERNAERTH